MKNVGLQAAPPSSRFKGLDGLRGIASVIVAASHFIIAFQIAMLNGDPASSHFHGDVALSHTGLVLLYNPELGVSVFFVLSGFVLSANVSHSSENLLTLYIRRWIRLAPPIIISAIFAWAIIRSGFNFCVPAAALAGSSWLAEEYTGASGSIMQLIHLFFQSATTLLLCLNTGTALSRHYNSNLWTMPIEFLGSLGLFACYKLFILPFIPRRGGRLIFVSFLVLILWNTVFYGFALGAWLYECHASITAMRRPARPKNLYFWINLAGAAILGLGLIFGGTPFELDIPAGGLYTTLAQVINPYVMPVSAITVMHKAAAFLILAGLLLFSPARTLLQTGFFQFLGRISFMMYLIQVPIICSLSAWLMLGLAPRFGYNTACVIAGCAYAISLAAFGHLLARMIDQPAIAASHRFTNARQKTVENFPFDRKML